MKKLLLALILIASLSLCGFSNTSAPDWYAHSDTVRTAATVPEKAANVKNPVTADVEKTNLDGLSVYPTTDEVIFPCGDECVEFSDGEVLVFLNGSVMPLGSAKTVDGEVLVSEKFAEDKLGFRQVNGNVRQVNGNVRQPDKGDYIPLDGLAETVEYNFAFFNGTEDGCMVPEMPQIMVSAYPKEADALSPDEAVARLRWDMIIAYEAAFGEFEPLFVKPKEYSDEESLKYLITTCSVKAENDRFYMIECVWEFFVDKYTSDIFMRYNGLDKTFVKFDPSAKGALAFAG